jgi:hypothetical protein
MILSVDRSVYAYVSYVPSIRLLALYFDFICISHFCIHIVIVLLISLSPCSVRLYLQLFVGELSSYLRYLCLLANSGVQHILCCVFVLFVFVLLPVSLVCPFFSAARLHFCEQAIKLQDVSSPVDIRLFT